MIINNLKKFFFELLKNVNRHSVKGSEMRVGSLVSAQILMKVGQTSSIMHDLTLGLRWNI